MSNASEEDNGEAKGSDNDANDNTNQAVGKITGCEIKSNAHHAHRTHSHH